MTMGKGTLMNAATNEAPASAAIDGLCSTCRPKRRMPSAITARMAGLMPSDMACPIGELPPVT